MFGSGWEALQDVRKWSGGPPGCPGVVGRPSRMSGCGREALSDVRETRPDVREWSEGSLVRPAVFRMPSRMSRIGREAPPGCLGVVERPSQMSRSVRVALPYVW